MGDDIGKVISDKAERISGIVSEYLPPVTGFQRTVCEAMSYSVDAGGKRLRPMLMEETYRLLGGSSDVIKPFMAAIEFIHTYSLIHDDLPALDNDDYRRGRKTSHVVYGEAMAILAGDALLNYAYETAARAFDMDADIRAVAEAMRILTKKAGIYGMVGGQVVDVEMTGHRMNRDELEFVYENKTGALIEAAMMTGAVLAGADRELTARVERIASDIGMAFQIQDDLLDILGDSAVLGKPVMSDEAVGKLTYVTIHGVDASRLYVKELSGRAVKGLEEIGGEDEFLKELVIWLIDRDR